LPTIFTKPLTDISFRQPAICYDETRMARIVEYAQNLISNQLSSSQKTNRYITDRQHSGTVCIPV